MQNNTEVAKQKLTWGNKLHIGYSFSNSAQ